MEEQTAQTYEAGQDVEAGGTYVCAPCGYKKELNEGDKFPECDSCMSGEQEALPEDDRLEGTGTWELTKEEVEDPPEGSVQEESAPEAV
jgi:hypothetical protein